MTILGGIWGRIQASLFPDLAESLDDPLIAKLRQFVAVLAIVRIEEHWVCREPQWMGRTRYIEESDNLSKVVTMSVVFCFGSSMG